GWPSRRGGEAGHPPPPEPPSRIGIDLGKRIEAGDAAWRARTPDPEWTDADEDCWLDSLHLALHRLDERVDVRPPPRVTITPALRAPVFPPCGVVGKRNVLNHAHAALSD